MKHKVVYKLHYFLKVKNGSDAALSSSMYCTCIRKMKQDIAIECFIWKQPEYVLIINCLFNYLLDTLEFIWFVSLGNIILYSGLMSWRG